MKKNDLVVVLMVLNILFALMSIAGILGFVHFSSKYYQLKETKCPEIYFGEPMFDIPKEVCAKVEWVSNESQWSGKNGIYYNNTQHILTMQGNNFVGYGIKMNVCDEVNSPLNDTRIFLCGGQQ